MSLLKNNVIVGLTAGLAATVLAPVLMPALKKSARPLAKTAIRGGMLLYQKGREAVAHSGEAVEDILAELHAEEKARRASDTTVAPAKPGRPLNDSEGVSHLSAVRPPPDTDLKQASDSSPS